MCVQTQVCVSETESQTQEVIWIMTVTLTNQHSLRTGPRSCLQINNIQILVPPAIISDLCHTVIFHRWHGNRHTVYHELKHPDSSVTGFPTPEERTHRAERLFHD